MSLPPTIPVNYVQLRVFEQATGYTPDAVQKKIKRGEWREGIHFRRAPDGHLMMDLRAFNSWVENPQQAA